jgi:breast cancer 2 susceptibility protein
MLESGCVERLVEKEWVWNAYRWIVWHHACVARSFPEPLTRGLCAADSILQRLLYKYEREILRARRPFLRRVWERDTSASVPAILVVSAVRRLPPSLGGASETSAVAGSARLGPDDDAAFADGAELEVSDGWYGARAVCDARLTSLVRSGKLFAGMKILIQGCETRPKEGEPRMLLSDDAEQSWLALRANQVKPAPWDAKLGAVCSRKGPAAFPLRALRPDGGRCSKTLVFVERVYPAIWTERDEAGGRAIHRSDAGEVRAARAWEDRRAACLEKHAERARRTRADAETAETAETFETAETAETGVKLALEREGVLERRSTRSTRLRVSGVAPVGGGIGASSRRTGSATLVAYDVDEDAARTIEEGHTYELTDIIVRGARGGGGGGGADGGIELVVGRRSRWRLVPPSSLARSGLAPSPTPRRLATVSDLGVSIHTGEEFDIVAVVVHRSPVAPRGAPGARWVFLADVSAAEGGGGSAPGARDVLAVEMDAQNQEPFADARACRFGSRSNADPPWSSSLVALENLRYVRRDLSNGVRVATFTLHSRVSAVSAELDSKKPFGSTGPFATGPNASTAFRRARAFLEARTTENGLDALSSLRARAAALTGSGDAEPPAAAAAARRSSLRRKRSLSLGSEMEWGASQLDVLEAAEAEVLEARRRGGSAAEPR